MKKIKVIDLLNKIYKGEKVPKKISIKEKYYKYEKDYYEFVYDKESRMYFNNDSEEFYTPYLITGFVDIFDEVYIVED